MGLFTRLTGKSAETTLKDPTAGRTTAATSERIKHVLGIRQLDSMPTQAARAFQLAGDPNAKSSDFVKVIESDEIISARIIRIANSVFFFRGVPATDIDKAIANIGLNELRCLLSASMLKSLLQGRSNAREQIWANAVATGIVCRSLSHFTNISDGEAFLCGLLHDIGKLILIRKGGSLYDQVIRKVGSEQKSFIDAEEEVFELNHVEVGKWVAENWNFPPAVVQAIAGHHLPWPTESKSMGKNCSPGMLVKVGDTIAHSAGIGLPSNLISFRKRQEDQLPLALKHLGISTKDGESFIQSFDKQFDQEFSRYQLEEFQ